MEGTINGSQRGVYLLMIRPSFSTIFMFLKEIDELFSFSDFTGSTREEGHQAA